MCLSKAESGESFSLSTHPGLYPSYLGAGERSISMWCSSNGLLRLVRFFLNSGGGENRECENECRRGKALK